MDPFLAWLEAHPAVVTLIIIPLVTALVNYIWKPRSPQEYVELGPRFGGFLKLMASVFPDPRGAIQGLKGMLTGKSIPALDIQTAIATAALKTNPDYAPETPKTTPPGSPL